MKTIKNTLPKNIGWFIIIIFLWSTNIQTLSEAAVITLQFPAGAENTGLGEVGVSYANTPYSVFWNPANVACLYETTYLNTVYSEFYEQLLPILKLPDLYHEFSVVSTTLNDIAPYVDAGYAYCHNYVNMGKNALTDSSGVEIGVVNSDESVISNHFGIRAFDILSVGFAVKKYNSRLAPGIGGSKYPNDGIAFGNAFDLGIRINKKYDIHEIAHINPALGFSLLNIWGDSAAYFDTSKTKYPLPKTAMAGISCEFNFLELVGYTYIHEANYSLISKSKYRTFHKGHKIQLTPFYAILIGRLESPAGESFETNYGYVVRFNFRKTIYMVAEVSKFLDILNGTNHSEKFENWDNMLTFYGFVFMPNIHIARSHSVILEQKPNHIRDEQTRDDWSVGIGIIGAFPDWL